MDLAFNHLEDSYVREQPSNDPSKPGQHASTLSEDIQETYKAFSASPWGAKIGGFLGTVRKQGESVYTQASKELAEVGEDATKGFNEIRDSLVSHTRNLSISTVTPQSSATDGDDSQATPTKSRAAGADGGAAADNENMLSRLRAEAAKRLKDLQKAEDAADEALLKFGSNVRDFLKEAITIAPPSDDAQSSTVLFESKDAQGKRVVHQSRFDAQLHVIHTSTESFTKDPGPAEYEQWTKDFDVEKKTDEISTDLEKYPELRTTMEKLVPDTIPYADFWKRYYFLRHSIETAEARRRDLLKAAAEEDDVGWDDDSEDDEAGAKSNKDAKPSSGNSSTTIQPPTQGLLKPNESRKSNDEKSQADSEASYDVVGATSGKTSQAPSSPKDPKKGDDSDDDWE
ncbi:hypothetical protein NLU13_7868 [Sarocladium strictum]|uniref:BSD domain-containing protein n=1 Tax=Sarocladium strictum TaxID=5046 RepID=A0AA39GFY8_SARSR|nr:hypothetical protein NLU13_7868 [Sarocladium strictum]